MEISQKTSDVIRLVLLLVLFPLVLAFSVVVGIWIFVCGILEFAFNGITYNFQDALFMFIAPFKALKDVVKELFEL